MMQENAFHLYLFAMILSAAGAWLIVIFGQKMNLIDHPNTRSSHNTPTPKGGGIGILATFVCVSLILRLPETFWIPLSILSITGLLGDRIELSPIFRLVFQFAVSIIFLLGYWKNFSNPASQFLIIIPLAIFMVATANYYNFMDGINGIAGITGAIGFALMAVFSYSRHIDANLTVLSVSMSLACLGFLPFNLPHARVFMGDVGSILLGFVFAAMVIWLSNSLLDFLCLASFMLPFYADELTTELVRLKQGEKLWLPHRRHLYQILANQYGISHWKISVGYGIAQLIIGLSIFYSMKAGIHAVAIAICFYIVIFSLLSHGVRKHLLNRSRT